MADQPRAVAVPFSSIVGTSVTIHAPDGHVIAQLGLLGVEAENRDEWKANCIALADEVAKAINLMPRMAEMLEVIRDGEADRVTDGEKRSMPETLLRQIGRLVDEAKA